MTRARRRKARWAGGMRAWPLWALRPWLVVLVVLVVVADLAAAGLSAWTLTLKVHDLALFGFLLAGIAVTVELTRSAGEKGGLIKDVYGAWDLPAAILLPPIYVLLAAVIQLALIQCRIRRAPLYRRSYSAAALGLSYVAAGLLFRYLYHLAGAGLPGSTVRHELGWFIAVMIAALAHVVINKSFMIVAVRGSDPTVGIKDAFFGREPLYNDLAEQCIGVLVTFGVAGNVFLAPVALPVVALLQRSLRHAQLLNDSRTDPKTGLLNARTWEREAAAEVARAVRARIPLAVAVLDIDWFKRVNDTYGHLFGDEALKEIARCLPGVLREYDSAGRFGGEEFVLLLPYTRAVDAFRIADRVRDHISGLSLRTADGQTVQVTVSVGVAALDAGSRRELSELLAAADAALYRAKRDGRNQVQMISTSRGLSAVGGRSGDGANLFGGVPAMAAAPTAWDVLPPEGAPADGADSTEDELAAGIGGGYEPGRLPAERAG
jgi:diguanylate cyclase (GGDEF)-like protein